MGKSFPKSVVSHEKALDFTILEPFFFSFFWGRANYLESRLYLGKTLSSAGEFMVKISPTYDSPPSLIPMSQPPEDGVDDAVVPCG